MWQYSGSKKRYEERFSCQIFVIKSLIYTEQRIEYTSAECVPPTVTIDSKKTALGVT